MAKRKGKVKERNVVAYAVKIRVSGAGAHTDKRKRRNKKGRKYNPWEGY